MLSNPMFNVATGNILGMRSGRQKKLGKAAPVTALGMGGIDQISRGTKRQANQGEEMERHVRPRYNLNATAIKRTVLPHGT